MGARLGRGLVALVGVALALAASAGAQTPEPAAPPQAEAATDAAAASQPPVANPPPAPRRPHAAAVAAASPAAAETIPPAQLQAFVDGVMKEAMAQRHIAGAAVAVIQDGQVILTRGYGAAHVDPWTPVDPNRTLFRLGDISQSLTWMLVLREVAAGHMRLDGPVNLYLPEALRVPDEGRSQPIRLQDILAGASGFEDRALGEAYERDFAGVRPLSVYLRQERPHRVREPGALAGRSDYAAALVGAAVAEVSGRPFEALAEQDIIGPLGLAHTSFREPHPDRSGMPPPLPEPLGDAISDGFRWTTSGLRLRPFEYIEQRAPSGSASASAGDMARLMTLLMAGGTLGNARLLSAADDARLIGPASVFQSRLLPGGVEGREIDGDTLSFHSSLTLIPAMRLGVFVAANTNTGGGLVHDLPARIVEQFRTGSAPVPAIGSGLLAARPGIEGPWLDDRRAYVGLEGFVDRFRRLAWLRVLDDHRLMISGPSGASRWTLIDGAQPMRLRETDGQDELAFGPGDAPSAFFLTSTPGAWQRPSLLDRPGPFAFLAVFTVLLSLLVLADFPVRFSQTFRESQGQRRAAVVQATQAILWLAAAAFFGVFGWQARDPAALMYDWPGIPLVLASSCALVASALFLPILLLMPPVWRGGRRVESWTARRKLAFTLTSLVFLTFAVLLGLWGALQPWSA